MQMLKQMGTERSTRRIARSSTSVELKQRGMKEERRRRWRAVGRKEAGERRVERRLRENRIAAAPPLPVFRSKLPSVKARREGRGEGRRVLEIPHV